VEVREIIRAVLDEERRRYSEGMDETVLKTVSTILSSFGIEEDERKELKADLAHLRSWRIATQQAKSAGWKAMIGIIVSGFAGLVWLGIQTKFGK
jgi:hypothetical protein